MYFGHPAAQFDECIGLRVLELRIEKSIDIEAASLACGVSQDRFEACEARRHTFTAGVLFQLMQFLDVQVTEFFAGLHSVAGENSNSRRTYGQMDPAAAH